MSSDTSCTTGTKQRRPRVALDDIDWAAGANYVGRGTRHYRPQFLNTRRRRRLQLSYPYHCNGYLQWEMALPITYTKHCCTRGVWATDQMDDLS